jgi:hypothetical protein
MIIDISKLNQTKGGTDFSYNDRAEDAITNAICYYYDLQANGGTVGLDPSYDKIINRTKVEIKISSSSVLYLEIAKGDGTPSGIFTSSADIYMTVNPGTDKGTNCMKVRVYNKMELEHWARHMLKNQEDELKSYPADSLGPGSSGFMLKFQAVEDLYVLGFEYERGASNQIKFDTHSVFQPSAFALSKMKNFIK